MHPQEKMAWYNLAVVGLTLSVYFTLLLITRYPDGSQAAFALLALSAFSGLFATSKQGKILGDEHDKLVNMKAGRAAFMVFWLYFVAYGMLSMRLWNYSETMPTFLMSTMLWGGFCVFLGAQSAATLIYYRSDSTERLTWADRFRQTGSLRMTGIVSTAMFVFISTPFTLAMIFVAPDNMPPGFVYLICGSFLVIYVLDWVLLSRTVQGEQLTQLRKAKKTGVIAFVTAGLAGGIGGWQATAAYPEADLSTVIPRAVFFVLVVGVLSLGVSLIVHGGRGQK